MTSVLRILVLLLAVSAVSSDEVIPSNHEKAANPEELLNGDPTTEEKDFRENVDVHAFHEMDTVGKKLSKLWY